MSNRMRMLALLLSAGTVAAIVASPAAADLARCRRCVERQDMARDSIGSPQIKNNSIKDHDIAAGAVGTAELADDAVDSSSLADGAVLPDHLSAAATPAIGVEELFGSTSDNTNPSELASFTVTVPADGTLVVTVAGSLYFQTYGLPSATLQAGEIGLCDTSASFDDCAGTHQVVRYDDANISNADNAPLGFALTRQVAVTAGDRTFYVNGFSDNLSTGFSLGDDAGIGAQDEGQTTVTAMFFPAALPITSTIGGDEVIL